MTRRSASLLVVDDEEMNRDMVSRRLIRQGCYKVDVASSGEQALQMVNHNRYDLVLLDQMMPGLNGMQVLAKIRENQELSQLPVIMLTALADSQFVVEAPRNGANDYITKPLDFAVALARLETQLSRRWTELELRESRERYALAARGSNDGIWDWDLETGKIYYSSRWAAIIGHEVHEIGDQPNEWFGRVHPADSDRLDSDLAAHQNGITSHLNNEHRIRHKDGTFRWVLSRGLAARRPDGKTVRIAGSLTDITQAKVADALTGLPNRLLLAERLSRSIERLRNNGPGYAVLFLDVDRFKVVNDSLGHIVGDRLLISIGERIAQCLRAGDVMRQYGPEPTLSRLGGDEFAILLESPSDQSTGELVAQRVLESLRSPFQIAGRDIYAGVSIGIAIGNRDYNSADEVLRDSDTAMYNAKLLGGSQTAVFDSGMRQRAVARMKIETALHSAIHRNEFRLQYQPIISLKSSRTVGFEALIRWKHPELGNVSPAEFIDIAEDIGLMSAIGVWVLEEACREAAKWTAEAGQALPYVSVNVSAKHLLSGSLVEEVDRVLDMFGLVPQRLRIEVTETALISDLGTAKDVILQLKERGVLASIDDFGTGYAGLQYLTKLPVSTLKIDRSFIAVMNDGPDNLPQAIVSLAHELGLDVVAEGIETADAAARLKSMTCESGQGYYFAKPLNPEDIADYSRRLR